MIILNISQFVTTVMEISKTTNYAGDTGFTPELSSSASLFSIHWN